MSQSNLNPLHLHFHSLKKQMATELAAAGGVAACKHEHATCGMIIHRKGRRRRRKRKQRLQTNFMFASCYDIYDRDVW